MKKNLLLATILVAGAATVGIAQFSTESKNESSAEGTFVKANSLDAIYFQDTTKPKKDSVPPKKDSTSNKF